MASEPDTAIEPEDAAPAQAAALDASPTEPVAEAVNAPVDLLTEAARGARENNDTTRLMDGANREWFVGTANVQNLSNVLIQVRRGEAIREAYLSTATYTPQAALAAILELDGALP